MLAFALPAEGVHPFRIVASHSDSPAFKLKPQAESPVGDKYLRLNVEMYGGMILPSWLDRPLSIAGRILVRQGGRIQTRLVDLGRDAAVIPNQPIHFCRNINDGYQYNPQLDMLPLYGDGHGKGAFAGGSGSGWRRGTGRHRGQRPVFVCPHARMRMGGKQLFLLQLPH